MAYKDSDSDFNSSIHKAAVRACRRTERGLVAFCMAASFDILGIIPGKPVEWP